MLTITHPYNLTRDLFDLEIEVKMEGEVLFREKANSLNENFLNIFYNYMGMFTLQAIRAFPWTRMDPITQVIPVTGIWSTIASISTTDPITLHTTSSMGLTPAAGDKLQLSGFRTPAKLNGLWTVTSVGGGNKDWVLTEASLAVVGTSAFVDSSTVARAIHFKTQPYGAGNDYPDGYQFSYPNIIVGSSSRATSKLDWGLYNHIQVGSATGQLVHESMIIAVPAVAGSTSTITVTRDFTNNSGQNITVREVGLTMSAYFDNAISDAAQVIVARDLSTFTITNGSTIEVSYRFNTKSTPAGGFLRQLGELMYRQMARLSREVKDIDNANQTQATSNEQFRVAVGGGSNYMEISPSPTIHKPMQYGGVQVGLSSTPVAFADYGLASKVQHGAATNQLYFYGTNVDGWLSNTTSNYFDISGMFENQSGATVTIKETGLYTFNNDLNEYIAISRHALAAAVEVPANQCLKVIYRLSV